MSQIIPKPEIMRTAQRTLGQLEIPKLMMIRPNSLLWSQSVHDCPVKSAQLAVVILCLASMRSSFVCAVQTNVFAW